jgi:hypothetical protein
MKKLILINLVLIFSINMLAQTSNTFKLDLSKYSTRVFSFKTNAKGPGWRLTVPLDLNGDGHTDFVSTGDDMAPSAQQEFTYLNFFENDGKNNFIDKTKKYSKDTLWSIRPTWPLVDDFNYDGKPDIYFTGEHVHRQMDNTSLKKYPFLKPGIDIDTSRNFSFITRRHHIYLSQPDGTYKDDVSFMQGMTPVSTFGTVAVDFNKDGYVDILNSVSTGSGWNIELFKNNSGKSMSKSSPFSIYGGINQDNIVYYRNKIDSIGGGAEGPENLKFYDVNNDSFLDLIMQDRQGNSLVILSQNKQLDYYSPVKKFDDLAKNDLVDGMPGSKLAVRGFYIADLNKSGNKQLIALWSNGGGDYQPGKKLYQLIKVFEFKNNFLEDATSSYFFPNENKGRNYGVATLSLIDLDQNGYIDLYPNGFDGDSNGGYQGYNGSDSTMFYKNVDGKFKLSSLGKKYYFKEFETMANIMKQNKLDTLHKFTIVNALMPVFSGPSKSLLFYSQQTEPGIDVAFLPTDELRDIKRKIYSDSLDNYYKGFVLKIIQCEAPIVKSLTPLTFCSGGNIILNSNWTNNQWYFNGSVINNATSSTLTVTTSGKYEVRAISGDCYSPLSSASTVVVNPIPPTPTITQESNGGLTSSASDGNQWYFNDVKIDNATQKTINPTKSGNYTVKVTTPCASEVSKPYNLVVTATEETILSQVQLSPNPFLNQFKVSFPVEFGKTAQVKIVDMSGNVHFKKASVSDGEVIELGSLNGGNYVLHLYSNDNANLKSIKISKIH